MSSMFFILSFQFELSYTSTFSLRCPICPNTMLVAQSYLLGIITDKRWNFGISDTSWLWRKP